MTGPQVCEHNRTSAMCEACVHAAALADPNRAPATRDELYPFPDGGAVTTGFLHESEDDLPKVMPKRQSRRKAR